MRSVIMRSKESLLPPFSIYETLRSVRFFAGFNQMEMAALLGMTQGWLSKFEHGVGDITVDHLIRLREHLDLSSDAIIDGRVPYLKLAEKFNARLRVPKRYSENAKTRVRMLYGFVHHYERSLGVVKIKVFFKDLQFPVEVFPEPNFPINIRLIFDLVESGIQRKLLNRPEAWNEVVAFNLMASGMESVPLAKNKNLSAHELFKLFSELNHNFTEDFSFKIKESGKRSLTLEIVHAETLEKYRKKRASSSPLLKSYAEALLKRAANQFLSSEDIHLEAISLSSTSPQLQQNYSEDTGFYVKW